MVAKAKERVVEGIKSGLHRLRVTTGDDICLHDAYARR